MTDEYALRLAEKWSQGHVCSLRDGEAKEYHKVCAAAIREKLEREKGCELCLTVSNADCELMKNFSTKDDFSGKEIVDDGNHPAQYIRRYKKRYFLVTEFADDEGTCIVCEIKNCPMCGRNLHL